MQFNQLTLNNTGNIIHYHLVFLILKNAIYLSIFTIYYIELFCDKTQKNNAFTVDCVLCLH